MKVDVDDDALNDQLRNEIEFDYYRGQSIRDIAFLELKFCKIGAFVVNLNKTVYMKLNLKEPIARFHDLKTTGTTINLALTCRNCYS